jgi:hypothetical protein
MLKLFMLMWIRRSLLCCRVILCQRVICGRAFVSSRHLLNQHEDSRGHVHVFDTTSTTLEV